MTTQELEQVTRELLRNIYHKDYIGKIGIQAMEPMGYEVTLGLQTPDQPKVICGIMDDESFLEFLKKELKACLFGMINYGQLWLDIPALCKPMDTRCGCNKE